MSITAILCNMLEIINNRYIIFYFIPMITVFGGLIILAVLPLYKENFTKKLYEILFVAAIFAFLILHRWPFLIYGEMNPDETAYIAAALTLQADPVFWRSVELGTSGPFSPFILLFAKMLGFELDYGIIKSIGLLMVAGIVSFFYGTLRIFYSAFLARSAIISMLMFSAIITYIGDFLAYNNEHPTILFLASGLYFASLLITVEESKTPWLCVLSGFVLGCIPFIKMQGVLLGVGIGFYAAIILIARVGLKREVIKPLLALVGGALLPTFICFIYLYAFNLTNDFYIRYVQGQIIYAGSLPVSLSLKIRVLFINIRTVESGMPKQFITFALNWSLILAVSAFIVRKLLKFRCSSPNNHNCLIIIIFSCVFLILSIISAAIPFKPSPHYILFIIFFVIFFIGVLTCEILSGIQNKVMLLTSCLLVVLVSVWPMGLFPFQVVPNKYVCAENTIHPISEVLMRYVHPGDRIAQWGWMDRFLVETKTVSATRTGLWNIVNDGNRKQYYLDLYIKEMKQSKPIVFLDAVAPGSFGFTDKEKFGFSLFPELSAYINNNFKLVEDIEGVRIYLSKEMIR